MKKIINNKVYDTDTATRIGSSDNGREYNDFAYSCETLYRKRTGEYFLHGEGGPMTSYAVRTGSNNWRGSERITPMPYAAARQWAEEHLSADAYEAEFGAVAEDDSQVTITLSLRADIVEALRRAAAEEGVPMSTYVERLLRPAAGLATSGNE